MSVLDKDLQTISMSLKNNETTSSKLILESVERAHKYQSDYNSFVTILENPANENNSDSILNGIPYSLKDNFSTKGILTTASSNILSNYVPVFNSTVYDRLSKSGAVLIGKTVLDELAMNGTGTTAHTGIVRNPWNKDHIIGGSSSGSAASVALGIVPFSIGTDTGDSVRRPAGYAGVVGFKPTYGMISRFGVVPFSSSLDHVGIITRKVFDVAHVLDVLKGIDKNDMTTYDEKTNFSDNLTDNVQNKKLFYIEEIVEEIKSNNEMYENFTKVLNHAKELGIEIHSESIDKNLLKVIKSTYLIISSAEATSNSSNLTGVIFGNRQDGKDVEEIMLNTRTNGFSESIKHRFIIGSYVLQTENQERFLKNASRIRRLIVEKINELLRKYDGMILPNTGTPAPKIEEELNKSQESNVLEDHLIIGNFGGFPSITIPSGLVNNLPAAINITGKVKDDLTVLKIAHALERKIDFKYLNERGEDNV